MIFKKRKMGLLLVVSMLLILLLVACGGGNSDEKLPSSPSGYQTNMLTTSVSETEENVVPKVVQYDVFDDFHVSFFGVTGYGEVTVELSDTIPEVILDNLKYTVSATKDVSNGDKIKISLQYDPNILKKNGYEITNNSLEYTVYGLKELIEIDPFDGLVLNYSGISPFCTVNFNNAGCNKEAQKYVSYSLEKERFANGESVIVHATIAENITKETGYVISKGKESFEYLCGNMPYYLESLEGIDLTLLESELQDVLKSAISFKSKQELFGIDADSFCKKYDSNYQHFHDPAFVDVSDLQSNEAFLLTIKESKKDEFLKGDIKIYNSLRIVSTCCAETKDKYDRKFTGNFYLCFNIENIIVYPDGTLKWGVDKEYQFTYRSATLDSLHQARETAIWAFSDNYNIGQIEKKDWFDF